MGKRPAPPRKCVLRRGKYDAEPLDGIWLGARSLEGLAERIGITEQNVSLLKSGKVKGVRFDTLALICEALDCQPGDIWNIATMPPTPSQPVAHAASFCRPHQRTFSTK